MLRLLIFAGLAFMVWQLFRWLTRGRQETAGEFEPMVSCAVCGVHIPRSNAVKKNDSYYCGEHGR